MKGEYVLRIRVLPKGHLSQQYVLVSHLVWFDLLRGYDRCDICLKVSQTGAMVAVRRLHAA